MGGGASSRKKQQQKTMAAAAEPPVPPPSQAPDQTAVPPPPTALTATTTAPASHAQQGGRTVLVVDERMCKHKGPAKHPEQPERLSGMLTALRDSGLAAECVSMVAGDSNDSTSSSNTKLGSLPTTLADVEVGTHTLLVHSRTHQPAPTMAKPLTTTSFTSQMVHTAAHIAMVDGFGDAATVHRDKGVVLSGTAAEDAARMAELTAERQKQGYSWQVAQDTYDCIATPSAARLAVASTLQCVAHVLGWPHPGAGPAAPLANAFALVRPPGHHCLANRTGGFCFFNNVAIAARVARRQWGVQRVAIVDWDVHHGDGTQDIVEHDADVLFVSLHRHDGGRFYPGTGPIQSVGGGRGLTKAGGGGGGASIAGASDDAAAATVSAATASAAKPAAAAATATATATSETAAALGRCVNIAWPCGRLGDAEYRAAFAALVLPMLAQFKAELLLVSAGFDAVRGDPLGGMLVTPPMYIVDDLAFATMGRCLLVFVC